MNDAMRIREEIKVIKGQFSMKSLVVNKRLRLTEMKDSDNIVSILCLVVRFFYLRYDEIVMYVPICTCVRAYVLYVNSPSLHKK